jgi:hypothetical protein
MAEHESEVHLEGKEFQSKPRARAAARSRSCVVTSLRGAERRSNPFFLCVATWIASRSLSSGAHSRDPLARNDESQSTGGLKFKLEGKRAIVVPANAGTHTPRPRVLAH